MSTLTTNQPTTVREVLQGTNWTALKDQKLELLSAIQDAEDAGEDATRKVLEGLLNWIDSLQDASHAEGYPVEFLTGTEEDNCDRCEKPLANRIVAGDSIFCSQTCADAPATVTANFMDAADAFQIVIDLAKKGIIHDLNAALSKSRDVIVQVNADEKATYDRQMIAIKVIKDIAVNQFGDDSGYGVCETCRADLDKGPHKPDCPML